MVASLRSAKGEVFSCGDSKIWGWREQRTIPECRGCFQAERSRCACVRPHNDIDGNRMN